jgi:hypothetical protein
MLYIPWTINKDSNSFEERYYAFKSNIENRRKNCSFQYCRYEYEIERQICTDENNNYTVPVT